jgi:hypothetical protein
MTLRRILEPLTVPTFLVEYFGMRPVHVPGPSARFAALGRNAANGDGCAAALARTLERDLETPVHEEQAGEQAMASSGSSPRQADCDLLVLQVEGRDLWKVYGRKADQTSGKPGWAALLEAGGAIYVPRGFWYVVTPEKAPSCKRIFEIKNPTGAELLGMMTELLGSTEVFQADIPRFAAPAVQAAYLSHLRKTVAGKFRLPNLLEGYCRRLNNRATGNLAGGVPGEVSAADRIELATPRLPRVHRVDRETISIRVQAVDYRFPVEAAELLQYVLDKAPFVVGDFCREMEGEFDGSELLDFLAALLRDGIVAVAHPGTAG